MPDKVNEFTDEEIAIAKSTNLCELASVCGYTVVRTGNMHSLKEHDSVRIHNQNTWYQWSTSLGGSPIDFLMHFLDRGFKEAVRELLSFNNYHRNDLKLNVKERENLNQRAKEVLEKNQRSQISEEKEFILPAKAEGYARLYAYLMKTRGISKDTVDFFVKNKLIYESADRHNIVFLSKDQEGNTRHAYQRGTIDAKPFKGDVAGNDKNFGFNLYSPKSNKVQVFEGAIDLMSYVDITRKYEDNYLSLGMVSDHPLDTYLNEHKNIEEIVFSLDNDEVGLKATQKLKVKYELDGYKVGLELPPNNHKDWNEYRKKLAIEEREKSLEKVKKNYR